MSNYSEACMEVSTILSFLNIEEYNKIPSDVIEVIEKNKNIEYEFKFDTNIELRQQKLLKETKAILYNLFRDYLSTPEQKEKIIQMQMEERYKINENKKQEYDVNNIFKNNKQDKIESDEQIVKEEVTALTEIKKESLIVRIVNKIKSFFKRV